MPVAAVPAFVREGSAWIKQHVPEGTLVGYGHAGDGNLHFNVSFLQPTGAEDAKRRESDVRRAIHDLVQSFGGSISAEHGIGRLKVGELARYASPVQSTKPRYVSRDADFFGTPERPKEVMRALKGRGIQWQAGVTSKLAQDDRMLELAAESGCTMLSIGFESISRSTLQSVHKHVNRPETFAALVEKIQVMELDDEPEEKPVEPLAE